MRKCDSFGGRLVNLDSCDELEKLQEVFEDMGIEDGGNYFVGTFSKGMNKAKERLRSKDTDDKINSYGYRTNIDIGANGLCGAGGGAPSNDVTNFFGITSDAGTLTTFSHEMTPEGVDGNLGGYVCEYDGN